MKTAGYQKHIRHTEHSGRDGVMRIIAVLTAVSVVLAACLSPSPEAHAAETGAGGTEGPKDDGNSAGGTEGPQDGGNTTGGADGPQDGGNTTGGTDGPQDDGNSAGGTDGPQDDGNSAGGTDGAQDDGNSAGSIDWTLDENGLLTILSDAGMADWISNSENTKKENITQAVISDGVTYIETGAFQGCGSLTEVTMLGATPPLLDAGAFADSRFAAESGQGIHVPEGAVQSYKTAWSESGYAQCIFDHIYSLIYNTDGGMLPGGGSPTASYTEGEALALPIPEKPGYLFDRWYENADLSGAPVDVLSPADYGDRIYYAKWTANTYTVTYYADGGTISDESWYTEYTVGEGLPELPTPTRWGFTFDGWYESTDYAGSNVTGISADETGDKTYYAKWVANTYTVTYNADGGTIPDGGAYTGYTEGVGLSLPIPEKPGYTFDGWYENPWFTGNKVAGIYTTDYGNKTYYAKWTVNTYTVTYNADGGTIPDENIYTDYIRGKGLTLPIPTKQGYLFDGWYESADYAGSRVTDISAADIGNKIYYAKWTTLKDMDPTAADYADTEIEVRGHTADGVVYSVDVEWGAMTFCYENSTWDATAHQSVTGGGWKVYDSETGEALDATETSINRIQVTNHSNAGIKAQLAYTRQTGYESIAGSFRKAQDDTDTNYETLTRTLTLATADNKKAADGAGKATVGTLYFMPIGRKQGLENSITKWTRLGTITVGVEPDEPEPQQDTGK